MMTRLVCALLLCLVAGAAAAETDAEARVKLMADADASVTAVVDGDTVVISPALAGAREVRLVGIQAPKLPLGRKGFKPWPKAADAKHALEAIVLGRQVRLHYGGARMDRHGRHLAHLFLADGGWVQGRMLLDGMARVYTFADNRAFARAMLAREAEAGPLLCELGTFQLVEGKVLKADRVKGRIYLNFGANWRDDFTATLAPAVARMAKGAGLDAAGLDGRDVRVRGWLKSRNGPMIEITHPEQIEVLAGR
ncbi:MAG: thermonuclease family protein [Rhodospirillaceae bacterium]